MKRFFSCACTDVVERCLAQLAAALGRALRGKGAAEVDTQDRGQFTALDGALALLVAAGFEPVAPGAPVLRYAGQRR